MFQRFGTSHAHPDASLGCGCCDFGNSRSKQICSSDEGTFGGAPGDRDGCSKAAHDDRVNNSAGHQSLGGDDQDELTSFPTDLQRFSGDSSMQQWMSLDGHGLSSEQSSMMAAGLIRNRFPGQGSLAENSEKDSLKPAANSTGLWQRITTSSGAADTSCERDFQGREVSILRADPEDS